MSQQANEATRARISSVFNKMTISSPFWTQTRHIQSLSPTLDLATGVFSFDFFKVKNKRIQGRFDDGRQGDHTVAYCLLLNILDQRIKNLTFPEMIKAVARVDWTQPNIHFELLLMWRLYTSINLFRDNSTHAFRPYGDVVNSYKQLMTSGNKYIIASSAIAKLKQCSKSLTQLQLNEEQQFNEILKFLSVEEWKIIDQVVDLFCKYLYHYIEWLQCLPFSAVDAGVRSKARGESVRFLNELSHYLNLKPDKTIQDAIGNLSKLFDENALARCMHACPERRVELIAFSLLVFESFLRSYPMAKVAFFRHRSQPTPWIPDDLDDIEVTKIASMVFYCWMKKDSTSFNPSPTNDEKMVIIEALKLINNLRSKITYKDYIIPNPEINFTPSTSYKPIYPDMSEYPSCKDESFGFDTWVKQMR